MAVTVLGVTGACNSRSSRTDGLDWDPMVFVAKRDGDEDVWMLRGGQATPITAQGVIDANPAWSPGDSRVTFTSG